MADATYDVTYIGAGPGGYVSAIRAAQLGLKVAIIEKRPTLGGTCLNVGCIPSKALLHSSHLYEEAKDGMAAHGVIASNVTLDLKSMMGHKDSVVDDTIKGVDYLMKKNKIERLIGTGSISAPGSVTVTDNKGKSNTITTKNIVIATGARPRVPDIPGLAALDYLTSDTVWDIRDLPERLLVVGAGPIGCELAQSFARLGSKVTLVTHADRLLPREDTEVSERVHAEFRRQHVKVHANYNPLFFDAAENEQTCVFSTPRGQRKLSFDRVLLAVGRSANVEGLGLENLGIAVGPEGTVEVDAFLRTAIPTIFACGDVAGPYMFTHMASHQAWYAAVNALFGRFRTFKVDYSVVPWATFTDPEVARVGLNEDEARAANIAFEVSRYELSELDRAIADGEAHGFIKVLTEPGRDRILGATIVGHHASELINEFVLAMKHGLGLGKILGTIHIYPTLSEGNKFVAGEWRKARKPEGLLRWVERYHRWNRG